MLLATALALFITGCACQDVYCSKQNRQQAPKGNHHPSFSSFLNRAEENCRCSQNLWRRRKCCSKTETQQTFVKWIARFYYFRHLYSAGSACVLLTLIAWVAHRYGQLYLQLPINILLGSFQLFLYSDCASLRWNNPVQRCSPVGGGCIIHAGGGGGFHVIDWQTALRNRRRPAATSSRRVSFSALASANSSCILHRAQQHHGWRIRGQR